MLSIVEYASNSNNDSDGDFTSIIFAAYHYELNQSRCGIASATRRANTNLSALVGTLYTPTLVSKPIQRFPSKHAITEKQTYPSKAQAPRRLWHLHLP
jgi:hypothetical protein